MNHTDCLYAYIQGGDYDLQTADGGVINGKFSTESLIFDHDKTQCYDETGKAKLVFGFKLTDETIIKSLQVSMQIKSRQARGYWEINSANLTIVRSDIDKKRTFPLKVDNLYASYSHSFSCSSLKLRNIITKSTNSSKVEPTVRLTLKRFQIQPFAASEYQIFASSFDCSVWLSIPIWTGLWFVIFMVSVIITAIYFLSEIQISSFTNLNDGIKFTQNQLSSGKISS